MTIDLFQDNQYQADRRLHRTNDPHVLSSLQTTHRLSHLRLLYSSLHFMYMLSRDNSHFLFQACLATVPTNMVTYMWNTDRKAVIVRTRKQRLGVPGRCTHLVPVCARHLIVYLRIVPDDQRLATLDVFLVVNHQQSVYDLLILGFFSL